MQTYEHDLFNECEHAKTTYYEYDTGYAEYMCELFGDWPCDECPLSFKWTIEEE